MSTRGAILVQEQGGRDPVLIYHHHDTYPSGLGRWLHWYVHERIPVLTKEHGSVTSPDYPKNHYYPPANILGESGKFAAVLLGEMWRTGWRSAYLYNTESVKTFNAGAGDTDWEYLYRITLTPQGPTLEWTKTGDKPDWQLCSLHPEMTAHRGDEDEMEFLPPMPVKPPKEEEPEETPAE